MQNTNLVSSTSAVRTAQSAPARPAAVTRTQFTRTAPTTRRQLALGSVADPLLTALLALTLGISLGFAALAVFPMELTAVNVVYAVQAFSAIAGAHLTLVLLLLVARIPALDRTLGHDGLVRAHRTLGPWAVWLIAVHVLLVVPLPVLGTQWPVQLWAMITSSTWYLLAALATLMFLAVGLTSWHRMRNRMKRGTWWSIHLYAYIGIALAFGHQVIGAGPFISGVARLWWISLYAVVVLAIVLWRVAVPLVQNQQLKLIVDAVVPETADTVSIWLRGESEAMARLNAQAGQFVNVRFWQRGLLWEAHPFSLSAPAFPNHLRLTVKNLGDASAAMQQLPVGTRAFIEGPYGITTSAAQRCNHALLVAGGIGIAPMRALAESLSNTPGLKVDLVVRARTWEELALHDELAKLNARQNVQVYFLIGSRLEHPIDHYLLDSFLTSTTSTDIYACGPEELLADLRTAAQTCGIPSSYVHIDSFEM